MKKFNLTVALEKKGNRIISGIVQYDTENIMDIILTHDDKAIDLSSVALIQITVAKPDGKEVVDSTGTRLQVIDPKEGFVSFVLDGQCTTCTGLHYCTISMFNVDGRKTTSARFAYYVAMSLEGNGAASESDYPVIQTLINKNIQIEQAEASRVIAEAAREAAEANRVSETAGVVAQATELMEQAKAYALDAKNYADACHDISGGIFITPTELANRCYTKTETDKKYVYDIPYATIS